MSVVSAPWAVSPMAAAPLWTKVLVVVLRIVDAARLVICVVTWPPTVVVSVTTCGGCGCTMMMVSVPPAPPWPPCPPWPPAPPAPPEASVIIMVLAPATSCAAVVASKIRLVVACEGGGGIGVAMSEDCAVSARGVVAAAGQLSIVCVTVTVETCTLPGAVTVTVAPLPLPPLYVFAGSKGFAPSP